MRNPFQAKVERIRLIEKSTALNIHSTGWLNKMSMTQDDLQAWKKEIQVVYGSHGKIIIC